MTPLVESLLFAFAAAWANIIGGVIVTSHKWARLSLRYFIALGSGFMLGTVFLEMVPESFKLTQGAPALILLGYAIVHMFEHVFASHLHFGEETHHDELINPVVGISALVGLLVHTFFDGVAIGAGFMISSRVGLLIFLAVFLHKIPDGFTIASIFVSSGYSNSRALGAAVALGVSTLIGVLVVHLASSAVDYALPLSTGSTLYVAATDLMPEVNREKGVKMAFIVFAGMGLFLLARTVANF
jgi:ZIP family zinc transporter/zinc and cadmium transporter